jgi:predicted ribosomally synthesized peptide with nif11-like leader
MTEQTAHQFLERLSSDVSFRAELQATGIANANAILDFATAKGFVFTEEELDAVLKEFPPSVIINQMRDRLKNKKPYTQTA